MLRLRRSGMRISLWVIRMIGEGYCDCDERCPKCGKKKKPKREYKWEPYRPGYGEGDIVWYGQKK